MSSGGTPFPWSEAVDDPCDLNTLFFTHAAWGDYNADGWLDLFISTGGGSVGGVNRLWKNTGSGFVRVLDAGPIVDDSGDTYHVAWGVSHAVARTMH